MRFFTSALATAAALFSSTVSAQGGFCPQDGKFCAQVGAPASTASSGAGNIYFSIEAVTSYAWVAIGTGSRMDGSTMFVVYSDGSGNVTVSPRSASGHRTPQFNNNVAVEILAGSGVVGGILTANFLCANCAGVIDASSTSTPWISAWRNGNPLDSASVSTGISQHNSYATFTLDIASSQLATDANPFVGTAAGGNGTDAGGGGGGGIDGGNTEGSSSVKGTTANLILVHGIVMAITFVFMYPVGAILMPLVGKWFIHAGWQMVAFMAMWAGFGVGYFKASDGGTLFKQPHTVLGTIVCCGMIIQPAIGFLHHRYYKKHQSRGIVSYAHIWYGRITMFVGIVNGGLGLKLSAASNTWVIAYSVVSAIVCVAYAASGYIGARRRNKSAGYTSTTSGSRGGLKSSKPQPQYSPDEETFGGQQSREQRNRGNFNLREQPNPYNGGQYAPRDQSRDQSRDQYGSYR